MHDAIVIPVPRVNPNDDLAVVVRWHADAGTWVESGVLLLTLETTKATFDVHAPAAGYLFYSAAPQARVDVGQAVAWISATPEPPAEAVATPGHAATGPAAVPGAGDARFTRKALRRLREAGVAPESFPERAGVVREEDVEAFLRERTTPPNREDVSPLPQAASKFIEIEQLRAAHREAITSAVSVAVDQRLVTARLRPPGAPAMTLLELAIHRTAALLGRYPELNGYFAEDRAWSYAEVSIGFAVNLGRGLRVPVVRRADQLTLAATGEAVRGLSLRYFREELSPADLTGGTFTVTDLSTQGVVSFLPVINRRQAAILGICAARPGTHHFDLTLVFDHRMTDGMQAATFLDELRRELEDPPGGAAG
jgi:2-oxoglutarate dehydrogenase E2 component (dihydrolipoamide succinyltransferase)